jgi:hypothetical protein
VRDLVPENIGNTLDDDLNVNEPVIAGEILIQLQIFSILSFTTLFSNRNN